MGEIQHTLDEISLIRSDAQKMRKRAREQRANDDNTSASRSFNNAAEKFQDAITRLRGELRAFRRESPGSSPEVCRLLELLSQTYGSQGGTYRDAEDLVKAIKCYDEGYKIELKRITECQHIDSYNLLQRLVVRILLVPKALSPDWKEPVHDVNVRAALDEAVKEIERQVFSGRDDSWALADLALARFLSGQDAEQAIRDLEGRKSDASFYESTLVVVEALIKEGLGGTALGEGLENFGRLLRRKGGMK
jgi:tetratricopeptide (TPR) repeat protein